MNGSGSARGRMEIASQAWGNGKLAPPILAGWLRHKITPQESARLWQSTRSEESSEKYMVITVLLELQQNSQSPWKHLNFAKSKQLE